MLRGAFLFVLLPLSMAQAQEPPPRVVVSAGVEWARFAGVEPLAEEGQTTTGFVSRDTGVDVAFGAEVAILRWLGVGVAHERLATFDLEQTFDVDGFRGFSNRLQRVLDPSVTEVYAAPSWPLADRVRMTGLAGIGFWRADENDTLALSFEGTELSRRDLGREHSGTTLVVGAGIDIWVHRSFGVRLGYKYLRLSTDTVEHPVHAFRALGLIGLGR